MAYVKIDEQFITAFQRGFIDHLQNSKEGENSVQEKIARSSPGQYGQITRIFDQLGDSSPCISIDALNARKLEAGSIEQYLRPIIDAIVPLLIVNDRCKLNDDVIKAIGVDNYCRLVNGKNIGKEPEIEIVADQQPLNEDATEDEKKQFKITEETFQENENELAEHFLKAILSCYSASFLQHNKPEQETEASKLSDLNNELKIEIQKMDNTSGDFKVDKTIQSPSYDDVTLDEYNDKARELMVQINEALDKPVRDRDELMTLCVYSNALSQRGLELTEIPRMDVRKITIELQGVLNNIQNETYSITNLQPQPEHIINTGLSYDSITKSVDALNQLLEEAEGHFAVGSPCALAVQQFRVDLALNVTEQIELFKVRSINEFLCQQVEEGYNVACANFKDAIKDAKPYEMTVFERILNRITFGLVYSDKKEKENICKDMKQRLIEYKRESSSTGLDIGAEIYQDEGAHMNVSF